MAALFGAFRCERDGPAQQPFRLFETAAFQLQMSRHAVGLGIVGIKTRGGEEILETLGPLARRQPPMRPVSSRISPAGMVTTSAAGFAQST